MSVADSKVMTIFCEALEHRTPRERAAYLDQACGPDAGLRARIEALLRAHGEAGDFLGGGPSASGPAATIDERPLTEGPGTRIGPYKLLQQIGEGGMGTVFMAEQTHPVQRKVALKVIKQGMDSRQVIARFEAERQALALMDHVNIARVLDAGATEAGRPYFVMELVHGVPITTYCDDNQLTPRQRLELFVPVCQAIQHAHQKGIIHRDVKPSNVMITLYDGQPVPKVIDFGVAKATEQRLTERTLFTQYGTIVGTLEYMSPEQAETIALGADTRSDIYSLGVLWYELLTGSTPLNSKHVREAAYGEILRMIKEEEPPKPSTRLSDSGETLASISTQRHMEPAALTKLVRGELDWIVMKALSSIGRSLPSLAIRIVWFARPTTTPSRSTRSTGFSTGWRVFSLRMANTTSRGLPVASSEVQPVSSWATEFRKLTRPSVSVAMTASPMLASVTRSHSRCSCTCSSARRRWTTMAVWLAPTPSSSRSRSVGKSALREPVTRIPWSSPIPKWVTATCSVPPPNGSGIVAGASV